MLMNFLHMPGTVLSVEIQKYYSMVDGGGEIERGEEGVIQGNSVYFPL